MIGKIIGAVAGKNLAQQVGGSGPAGALLGAVAVIRRLSPVTLVAAAVGGYLLKRHYDKTHDEGRPTRPSATPE